MLVVGGRQWKAHELSPLTVSSDVHSENAVNVLERHPAEVFAFEDIGALWKVFVWLKMGCGIECT